jgi:hypothetical protein
MFDKMRMRSFAAIAVSAVVVVACGVVSASAGTENDKDAVVEILRSRETLVMSASGKARVETWHSLDPDAVAVLPPDIRPKQETGEAQLIDWKFKGRMYREESTHEGKHGIETVVGYDGNQGYFYSVGSKFLMTRDRMAEVLTGAKMESTVIGSVSIPGWLQLEHMYGRSSANAFGSFGATPLSATLASKKVVFAGVEDVDGISCWHFTLDDGKEELSWWVAPSLNGLLVKKSSHWSRTTWVTRVTKTKTFDSGIVLPVAVELTCNIEHLANDKTVSPVIKTTFTLESVEVNQDIPDSAFTFTPKSDDKVSDGHG